MKPWVWITLMVATFWIGIGIGYIDGQETVVYQSETHIIELQEGLPLCEPWSI